MSEETLKWVLGLPLAVLLCAVALGAIYLATLAMKAKLRIPGKLTPKRVLVENGESEPEHEDAATSSVLTAMQAARLRNIETVCMRTEQRLVELLVPPGRPGLMSILERLDATLDASTMAQRSVAEVQQKILVALLDMLKEHRDLAKVQKDFTEAASNVLAARR